MTEPTEPQTMTQIKVVVNKGSKMEKSRKTQISITKTNRPVPENTSTKVTIIWLIGYKYDANKLISC